MNVLFLRGLFNRKNEGPGSDYSLPDVPSEPTTMRDLLLSCVVFICGNFAAVFFLTAWDYHLATQCAVVQLTVTVFLLYKLKDTLKF